MIIMIFILSSRLLFYLLADTIAKQEDENSFARQGAEFYTVGSAITRLNRMRVLNVKGSFKGLGYPPESQSSLIVVLA